MRGNLKSAQIRLLGLLLLFLITASGVFAFSAAKSHQAKPALSVETALKAIDFAAENDISIDSEFSANLRQSINFNRNRYYSPALGRFISKDPIGFNGGMNLYGYVANNPLIYTDPFGLTKVTEILAAYFSSSTSARLWSMGADDEYTGKIRVWQAVQGAVYAAQYDLESRCETWKLSRMTDPTWLPGMSAAADHNAWAQSIISPPGTDPESAANAYFEYFKTGKIPEDLWTSAIGSFNLYATVDNVDCNCKTATLRFSMYNQMSRQSFGRFAKYFPFAGQASQHMWWNWTEKYNWGDGSTGGSDNSSGGGRW